ncbi:hypothetical protein GCN74_09105 [Janthinobacterium sp. FT14W]|uniref:hypothetical protein n=1 Tax=Janthinobacterium sp. FT14W TaxID=2654253 RepID=UPI001263ECB1|nr:hypothetical protein [Janthinobacterium sp. FT14W]KAB8060426.1 hypothetical protein GCN74_09105 [Janthinobacterium sp. FT14W]
MNDKSFNLKQVEVSNINPVSKGIRSSFSITLHEYQGKAYINWSESFPGMVRLAVAIYSGTPPSNPAAWLNATEITNSTSGSWNSGQTWGTGYSAALLGVNETNNAWIYIGCNTDVTT